MAWWGWLLVAWGLLAVVLGIGLGLALRAADRLDRGRGRLEVDVSDHERDSA